MQLSSGSSELEPIGASGSGAQSSLQPKDLRPSCPPAKLQSNPAAGSISIGLFRMREMKLQDLKTKSPAELVTFAEELEVENASTMRKQELMFGILKQLVGARDRYCRRRRGRGAAGRLRLPALAGGELSARPRRHLRLALADPPLRAAHRRHHRRPDPQPQGRRALLRAAQGQHDQFRGPREGPPQGQLRQPDAALSGRAAEDGTRGSDQEGSLRRASSTSSRRSARASAR